MNLSGPLLSLSSSHDSAVLSDDGGYEVMCRYQGSTLLQMEDCEEDGRVNG